MSEGTSRDEDTKAAQPELRPLNCRIRLRDEGKPLPKTGCGVLGCAGAFGRCPYSTEENKDHLMTSWVTYARPFAKRIVVYRKRMAERDDDYHERALGYIEAVQYAWAQFRNDIIKGHPE